MSWFKVLIISFLLSMLACTPKTVERVNEAPKEVDHVAEGVPIMTFDKVFHDFGPVKKGEKKETTFTYTNTGTETLYVDIITSCHCTLLDYDTTPVPPGESSVINVVFDSSSKDEKETVDITIILKNENPKNGYPIVEEVKFTFDLIK